MKFPTVNLVITAFPAQIDCFYVTADILMVTKVFFKTGKILIF